jgi:hypothetical protein
MNKTIKLPDPFVWLLILALLFMVILGVSCTTERKVVKFLDKNEQFAATECADRFPIQETSDTVYVEPDSELMESYEKHFAEYSAMIDSLLTIRCPDGKTEFIERLKEVPGKPIVRVVTKVQESTAKLEAAKYLWEGEREQLKGEAATYKREAEQKSVLLENSKKQVEAVKKQRNTYLWLFIALLVWTFRKPLLTLIRKLLIKI